ncbi:hypothetical protein BC826DRAFT_982529 [Russula brevipes]|nr:hypothetical protein BC826DRAFT_982529 [Russula brevipes]
MRFTITLRNILLMSTTAAFMPLLGAAFTTPFITSPTTDTTITAGDDIQIKWTLQDDTSVLVDSNSGSILLCSYDYGTSTLKTGVDKSDMQATVTIPPDAQGEGFSIQFLLDTGGVLTGSGSSGSATDLTIN